MKTYGEKYYFLPYRGLGFGMGASRFFLLSDISLFFLQKFRISNKVKKRKYFISGIHEEDKYPRDSCACVYAYVVLWYNVSKVRCCAKLEFYSNQSEILLPHMYFCKKNNIKQWIFSSIYIYQNFNISRRFYNLYVSLVSY